MDRMASTRRAPGLHPAATRGILGVVAIVAFVAGVVALAAGLSGGVPLLAIGFAIAACAAGSDSRRSGDWR